MERDDSSRPGASDSSSLNIDSAISQASLNTPSSAKYSNFNGETNPISNMPDYLPDNTIPVAPMGIPKLYLNGSTYSEKTQQNSSLSTPNVGSDPLANMPSSYVHYADDPKLVVGLNMYDPLFNTPYSISTQNSHIDGQLANSIAGVPPVQVVQLPPEDHLVVGDYSNELLFHYVTHLEDKPHFNVKTIRIEELSSYDLKVPFSMHILINADSGSTAELETVIPILLAGAPSFKSCENLSYHIVFPSTMKWSETPESWTNVYIQFMDALKQAAGSKVEQCSIIRKFDTSTIYITEIDALVALGKDMSDDISRWENLRILDYSYNCLRLLPGVKFPDSLEVLNIGGGESLETLAGFKMPPNLKVLDVSHNQLKSIDYVFPPSLRRLNLQNNCIYSLDYIKLPQQLSALDLSQNRIDTIKYVNFPRELTFLSVAHNPIECMKGARFPEKIEYLDVSCIPNESMAGIKFPDSTLCLNLQLSMTNTRGLKLPPYVKELNMACNGVNSINPLKLPNTIEKLFLANNNIKTLSKVSFPTGLKELYLGNNLITSLKNVLFPPTLEVLDMEMNPDLEENEKDISSLKDVILPSNLRILRLGYHLIKAIESMDFPFYLEELSIQYNDLRMFRNVKFGPKLRFLDLSGNQELMNVDNVYFPETLLEMRIPSTLLSNLPADIVKRANNRELILTKSLPYTI